MRLAGWLLVAVGFALGFALGFGVPLAEAVPGLGRAEEAGALAYWVLIRPSWVVPMLAGMVLLIVAGWLNKAPDGA